VVPSLAAIAGALALGALSAASLGGSWWLPASLVGVAGLAVRAAAPAHAPALLIVAAVAAGGAGHARYAAQASRAPPAIASAAGPRELTGLLREDALVRGLVARFDIDLERLDGAPASGSVRVSMRAPAVPLREGDRVRLRGKVERPPAVAGFDYASYLRGRGIHAVVAFPREWERLAPGPPGPGAWLRALRRWATGNIERSLPEPAAALAAGVLLGERGTMDRDTAEALRVTGTTHLVVVSGQNVAMLLGSVVALASAVTSRRRAALAGLALLPPYVLLVGPDPPVVRAAIMAVGLVLASVTGRRTPGWLYLVYASTAMLAATPSLAVDVAFQLSVSATAGVIVLAPALRDAALRRLSPGVAASLAPLVEVAATATAATLAVVPPQAAAFERLSLIAVPANVIVAPLYEGTLVVALVAGFAGWADLVASAAWNVAALVPLAFLTTAEALARAPAASVPMRVPLLAGALWYVALGWAVARAARWPRPALDPHAGRVPVGRTVGLVAVAIAVWALALSPAKALARVEVLDVGQGLAVLVSDGGRAVLIDAGPPDGAVLRALARAGAPRRLDALAITHADADHAGGTREVTSRFRVDSVLATDRTLRALPVAGRVLGLGDRIHLGARTTIDVIAPAPASVGGLAERAPNDDSLVLLVRIGERRVLVAADIEADAEAWLVRSGQDLRADALVVPHHGSRTSSTPAFVAAVRPRVAIVSVGRGNRYGHPAPEVLQRYEGAVIRRTDLDGDVSVRSDGRRLWMHPAAPRRAPRRRRAGAAGRRRARCAGASGRLYCAFSPGAACAATHPETGAPRARP